MTAIIITSVEGRVTWANSVAHDWWKTGSQDLVGRFLLDLFQMEVVAEAEEDKIFQWEWLRDTSAAEPLDLMLASDDPDEEPFPVKLRLEEMGGEAPGGHLLLCLSKEESIVQSSPKLSPQTSPMTQEAPAPVRDFGQPSHRLRDLELAEHIGFFDMELPEGACWFSPAWKRMLGYLPHELADHRDTLVKLTHPEDSEATPEHPQSGKPGQSIPFSVEFRVRHKSGHYVWVQSVGLHEYGPAGELERAFGFHLDINERKEIEEEALQNEDRFLAMVQRGKLGFFDLDLRNRTAFFSPAWQQLLGYKEGDLANMPETFKQLLDASDSGNDLASVFAAPRGQSTFTRELRMQKKDGGFLNLRTQIIRLSNRRNELTRVLGFQTTSEAVSAPTPARSGPSLIEPEILYAALESVNEAVVISDADATLAFANRKAVDLCGPSILELIGHKITQAVPLLRSFDQRPAMNLADQVLSAGDPIHFSREFLLEQADGDPRAIVLSCLPLRDSREKILGAILVFRDPLEMSLSPEELAKSNRMESLGMLAGGIAHDVNNLLTTIVGGVSLARESRDWALLDTSEKACLEAKNLTRQLLTFARGRDSERKAQHLGNLIKDCVRLASSGASIRPQIDLAPELHPVEVDGASMSQVFQNLIINAIQGMDKAGGNLSITGENVVLQADDQAGLAAGDYLRIAVKDTGKGIPKEDLLRIFDPFFTTKKTGTGLGLSTVAAIIRNHEGKITVASEVGVGTTFFVYLPKTNEAIAVKGRRVPTLKFGTGRILFMDDDEEISTLAAGMLKRLDYEFDMVRNGEEAIALYRRYLKLNRPYDAVILDLTIIGGMGGEATLEKLRALDPDIRAIVSSGYATDDSHDYYSAKGFYAVLSKPYRSEEMGRVLRYVRGLADEPV